MWEYNKEVISVSNNFPIDYKIVDIMNELGEDGWEIFSITENGVIEHKNYGEQQNIVYTLYMKRFKRIV